MALTTMDYAAYRTLQEALHRGLDEAQGHGYTPRQLTWDDIGRALDEAVTALEASGYRVVKA